MDVDKTAKDTEPRHILPRPLTVIAVVVGKLVLVPLLGIAVLALVANAGSWSSVLIPEVYLMQLVFVLEFSVPSAPRIVMLCQKLDQTRAARAISYIYLWQYACALVTLPTFLSIGMLLLSV